MSVRPTMLAPKANNIRWSLGKLHECAEIAELALSAFNPYYREAWNESQISSLITEPSAWVDLGRDDGRLVAFSLCRQAADEVELLLCAIHTDYRGRGLGKALVSQSADTARARGNSRIFLEVRDGNSAAIGLYTASGFKPSGRRPGYYRTVGGETIDALTFFLLL